MNQLTKHQSNPAAPPPRNSGLPENTLAIMRNHVEATKDGLFLPKADMPSGDLREAMQARLATLRASLRPAGTDAIRPDFVAIFAVKACRNVEAGDAALIHRIYAEDLADLPLFAVREACTRIRRDPDRWAPTPGEIRQAAQREAKPFRDELAGLERLLSAKPLLERGKRPATAEERRKIIEAAARVNRDEVEVFPPALVAEDVRHVEADKAAATARLREMAREAGNEWRG